MPHKAIARRLGCSPSTVATHLSIVREKRSKAELPITKPTDYRDHLREQQLDRDRLDYAEDERRDHHLDRAAESVCA
jgi:hypothetical protein